MPTTQYPLAANHRPFTVALAAEDNRSRALAVIDRWLTAKSGKVPDLPVRPTPPAGVGRGNIGVWDPVVEDGAVSFVQKQGNPLQTARIAPKRDGKRIVLIGESVANGYPFNPAFSCASVVKRMLQIGYSDEPIDVVDISVIGLRFAELLQMIESAHQLEPDMYVVFAGNNWHLSDIPSIELDRVASILREEGSWKPLASYFDAMMRRLAATVIDRLAAVSRRHNVPAIFVIPEFSLQDWPYAAEWCNPLVAGTAHARWRETHQQAEEALRIGDIDRAEMLGREVTEVEEGLSVLGLRLLGQCALQRGQFDKARLLMESARDACRAHTVMGVFGCCSAFQDEIRRGAAVEGIELVDLPVLFAQAHPERLPGNDLFVDSVHLSPEGIRIVAAWIAMKALPLLGRAPASYEELMGLPLQIPPRAYALGHWTRALGHFVAALSETRGAAGKELVRHHCREALLQAPETADLMALYLDSQNRRAPDALCKSFYDFLSRAAALNLVLPALASSVKRLDLEQVRIILEEVSAIVPTAREQFDKVLREEHAIRGDTNLLDSRFEPNQLHHYSRHEAPHFVAYWHESRFRFILDSFRHLSLQLTFRVSAAGSNARAVRLSVNGKNIDSQLSSPQWQTWNVVVPSHLLHEGANELVIHWPLVDVSKEQRVREICERLDQPSILETRYIPNVYPIYGEVHAFTARIVDTTGLQRCDFIDQCSENPQLVAPVD